MPKDSRSEIWKAPNILSMFRILCVPIFLLFLLQKRSGAAFAVFIMASCTDFLDGFIARTWNLRTRLGKFLDPAADKLLMAASYIALSITTLEYANTIPLWLTAVVFGRDLFIVSCAAILYKKIQKKVIRVLTLGKITTVFQMGVIFLVLLHNTIGTSPAYLLWLYLITAALTILSGFGYTRQGKKMLEEYGPPKE
jgi:CDP-diacylglycerol--glycerol-3-phosphate 3-phosphatidyltransferase